MAVPVALVNLFNSVVENGNTTWAAFDCYQITLFGGGVLLYTTAPFNILFGGQLYLASGTLIDDADTKAQAHLKVGLDVDTWQVTIKPRPANPVTGAAFPDPINGVPWLQAASVGALDAADFVVSRAYFNAMPTYPIPPTGAVPIGARVVFGGVVAELDLSTTACVLTANDYRQLLTIQMPRNLYQSQCRRVLFDVGCTLVASAYVQSGTVQAGSTDLTVNTTLAPPAGTSNTFALGRIVFTSGPNNTFQSTIRTWDGVSALGMFAPLPFTPSVGDSFELYPGCAKHLGACAAYGNTGNYGGEPYIPSPETAA